MAPSERTANAVETSQTTPQRPAPLDGLRVTIVGMGRVGRSFGHWLLQSGASLDAVSSRRAPEAEMLARWQTRFIALDQVCSGSSDLLLLATPDATLEPLSQGLSQRPQAAVALHASGALGGDILDPLRRSGVAVGTLHPLRAFVQPSVDLAEASGTFFGLGGDPAAVDLGHRLASAWDGQAAVVPDAARSLYHFAATLAAGGVTTLLAMAEEVAEALDLPPAVRHGYLGLARGALDHSEALGSAGRAITGPAARRDDETLERQRQALRRQLPHLLPMFENLIEASQRHVDRCQRTSSSATMPEQDSGIDQEPSREL